MSIFQTNPSHHLAYLNAAGLPTTILTGSGAKNALLTVGKSYRLQPQGGAVYVGWGPDAATADTNGGSAAGEFLDDGQTVQFTVTNASVQYLSRTPASGTTDLRVWEVARP